MVPWYTKESEKNNSQERKTNQNQRMQEKPLKIEV